MRRDLVQRAMAHDHEAFTELARLSIDKLYAIARLILHDPDRADDATQEALMGAWRDIAVLRDPDRFERLAAPPARPRVLPRGPSGTGTRTESSSTCRRSIRAAPDVSDRSLIATSSSAPSCASTPDQRALIVLHYYLGLPVAETAEALGLPGRDDEVPVASLTSAMRASLESDARKDVVPGRTA